MTSGAWTPFADFLGRVSPALKSVWLLRDSEGRHPPSRPPSTARRGGQALGVLVPDRSLPLARGAAVGTLLVHRGNPGQRCPVWRGAAVTAEAGGSSVPCGGDGAQVPRIKQQMVSRGLGTPKGHPSPFARPLDLAPFSAALGALG